MRSCLCTKFLKTVSVLMKAVSHKSHKSTLLILNVSIVSAPVIVVSYLTITFFQLRIIFLELLSNLVLFFFNFYYVLNLVLFFQLNIIFFNLYFLTCVLNLLFLIQYDFLNLILFLQHLKTDDCGTMVIKNLPRLSVNFQFFHVKPSDFRFVTRFMSIFKFGLPGLSFENFRTKEQLSYFDLFQYFSINESQYHFKSLYCLKVGI